jgi:hypothetical protein
LTLVRQSNRAPGKGALFGRGTERGDYLLFEVLLLVAARFTVMVAEAVLPALSLATALIL